MLLLTCMNESRDSVISCKPVACLTKFKGCNQYSFTAHKAAGLHRELFLMDTGDKNRCLLLQKLQTQIQLRTDFLFAFHIYMVTNFNSPNVF
jgi:hypothetical protein